MRTRLIYVWPLVLGLLVACAGQTPEQVLDAGYKSASVTVRATTMLLTRGAISSTEAEKAHTLGVTAKETLDEGKAQLVICRATPGAVCEGGNANIQLGSGVLLQLETYLKAKEPK